MTVMSLLNESGGGHPICDDLYPLLPVSLYYDETCRQADGIF